MLSAVKFHECRRCGGDLFLDSDEDGNCFYCLQCGAVYAAQSPDKDSVSTKASTKMPMTYSSLGSPEAASRSRIHRFISSKAGGAT